ncbi:hypothetical protein [Mucilaginibacter sp.]|jgi:hypothetical protein|uniref:hypothetical protein n=1 Tax=Mucilaginibacter sp. TaxID=1882438 RepID=UPI0035671A58
MEAFYIDVELSRGMTRIQVDEVPPEQWPVPYSPQFVIEYHNGQQFITLTLQLEQGRWYDRDTRLAGQDFHLHYFQAGNPGYQSPLSETALREIGEAIGRHMVVHLCNYMGLFVPVFREPSFN